MKPGNDTNMHVSLLWSGIDRTSLESCELTRTNVDSIVHVAVIGDGEGKLYTIDYHITTDANWHTTSFSCEGFIHQPKKKAVSLKLEVNGKKEWNVNGIPTPELNGCVDIDLSLTPFTNTLPIRRLQLGIGQSQSIAVVYIDLLAGEVKPARQCYTCTGERRYKYQNIPDDFEAIITVDAVGLVEHYEGLFERNAIVNHS